MAATVVDLEVEFLKALGFTGSLQDLEFQYYSSLSGLPVANSVSDHQKKYLENATGLSNRSIADLESAFYDLEGIPGGASSSRAYTYYARNIPPTLLGGFGIQGGVAGVTMPFAGIGVPVKANDMVLLFTVSKLSDTDPTTPGGYTSLGGQACGTGIDGVDTGLIKLKAFWGVPVADSPSDPAIAVAGGNVVLGNGIVFRASPSKIWTPPTITFGDENTHDLNFAAVGAANLEARVRDIIAFIGAGTANAPIQSGRTITVPGCTGNNVGINSTGTNTGNHAYIWENIFTILTGTQSGAATVNGTFAANQSGGAMMVRLR